MSVNLKDSTKPNKLNPIAGRISDDRYSYADALSLEEISASDPALLVNKIPKAEAVGELNNKVPFRLGIDENGNYGYYKDGADSVTPFRSGGGIVFTIRYDSPTYNCSTFSNQVQTDNSVARDVAKTLEDNEYFKVTYKRSHIADIEYKKDCYWVGNDGVLTIKSSGNTDTFSKNFYASCPFTIIGA